ncbi:unnamed protein product, partial [Mesorhabditis spiculigera]
MSRKLPSGKRVSVPRIGTDFPPLDISSILPDSDDSDCRIVDFLDESSFIEELAKQREADELRRANIENETPEDRYIEKSSQKSIVSDDSDSARRTTYDLEGEEKQTTRPSRFEITDVFAEISNSSRQSSDSMGSPRPSTSRAPEKTLPFCDRMSSGFNFTASRQIRKSGNLWQIDSSMEEESSGKQKRYSDVFITSSDKAFENVFSDVEDLLPAENPCQQNAASSVRIDLLKVSQQTQCRSFVLKGCRILVEIKCCTEYATKLRLLARNIGATVTNALDTAVTHVIFGCGGDNKTPEIVAPSWLESCAELMEKLSPDTYSIKKVMADEVAEASRFTNQREADDDDDDVIVISSGSVEAERRGSFAPPKDVARRSSAASELQRIFDQTSRTDTSLDHPVTTNQLLQYLNKMNFQERLDQLMRCDSTGHGARCMSGGLLAQYAPSPQDSFGADADGFQDDLPPAPTQQSTQQPGPSAPRFSKPRSKTRRPIEAGQAAKIGTIFEQRKILRRRSMGGFSLQHRAPDSLAALKQRENLDELAVVNCLPLPVKLKKAKPKPKSRTQLTQTRKRITKKARARKAPSPVSRLSQAVSVMEIDDGSQNSTIDPARKSFVRTQRRLRYRGPPRSSQHRTPSGSRFRGEPRTPIVDTASSFLNRVLATPSSDEFAHPRTSRYASKKVSLTQIPTRSEEARLRELLEDLGLEAVKQPNEETRCVVSGHGDRTLQVFLAVVYELPIVTPQWLIDSADAGRPLSYHKYEYEQWADLATARKSRTRNGVCELFRPLGGIYIDKGCNKPAATHMKTIVARSGGSLVSSVDGAMMIVCPEDVAHPVPPFSTQIVVSLVTEKYILDCIVENKLLSLRGYSRPVVPENSFLSNDENSDEPSHLTD